VRFLPLLRLAVMEQEVVDVYPDPVYADADVYPVADETNGWDDV
jgi:hypothetical protein